MITNLRFPRLRRLLAAALLALAPGLAPAAAAAAEAFVIESERADLAAGSAVDTSSRVRIEDAGHVVVMDAAGRMMRRNGPFSGTMAEAVGLGRSGAGAAMSDGVIDALVDLARASATSRNRLLATRTIGGAGPETADAFTIRAEQRVYCHRRDRLPAFVLRNPPTRDRAIVLDRYDPPLTSEDGRWRAGQHRFDWPGDWPEPQDGSYRWSVGDLSEEFEVRTFWPRTAADDHLAVAAELGRLGCTAQAEAALRQAIAAAGVVD